MRYTFKLFDGKDPKIVVSDDIDPRSDEGEVLALLLKAQMESWGKVNKTAIMRTLSKLGSHERFEHHKPETTRRKAHQIIRNLRDMNVPVISDTKGSWLAVCVSDVEDFCNYLEVKAKSDIESMLTLKKKMLRMVESKQTSLFDKLFR
jgi:translation initiation factor 2 beta subunit (eIF-2beta)/eIF-5